MAINLQIFLGTVNYTDYLHVTAAKVASPSTVVWEDWIAVPVTNYTLVIPGLDPDDYYISFYDSPDNVSLGTLVSQCFVNARNPEYAYEVRFYEIGNLPVTATLDVTEKIITDTYLVGKTIESYFKEGFRFLDDSEIDFDDAFGAMELLTGGNFETGEKFAITIKYAVGTVAAAGSGGLYVGTLNVSAATYTLLVADKNKRIRCVGSAASQVITFPALSTLAVDDGYYFDNTTTGVAVQVKLLTNGGDRVRYNGFMAASDEYAEFWVSKGEVVLIRKYDDDYWEVITEYKGVEVGNRMAAGYASMPAYLPEDGALIDGDEYPRLSWWVYNILPASHTIVSDALLASGVHTVGREGLFIVGTSGNDFRMPNTQGLSERGLLDFDTYGADAGRVYDYPGGVQNAQVGEFNYTIALPKGHSYTGAPNQLRLGNGSTTPQSFNLTGTMNTGNEQRVKNAGVIYMRHI